MDSSAIQVVTFQNHHGNTKTNETQQNHPPSNIHGGWRAAIFIIFVNTWLGVTAFCPFLGAFIADSFLGRFRTILISFIIYCVAVFFIALYVVSIGEGGHKPCPQTFAADRFGEDTEEEKKAKSSFFNWWYFGLALGASAAIFAVIYVQDNIGWAAGFEILAGGMGAALGLFLLGIRRYKKQGPLGSPFTATAQVFVAATRKWNLKIVGHKPADHPYFGIYYGDHDHSSILKPRTLAPTNQFRFLDKATMIDKMDTSNNIRNPWRLCSTNQVEEVKLVLRLIPIWMTCIMLLVVQSLVNTYFTIQGRTMIRSIGPNFKLPPASLQIFAGFTIILTIPIYERVFVPLARKLTGKPSGITVLQRIGGGLFMSLVNMVVSALVEAKRLSVAREHKLIDNPKAVVVPMKVWWLLPQYVLCGFSDALSFVGIQELFYNEMPESLRSLGAAAYVSIAGVANFISNAIMSVVQGLSSNYGHSNWLDDNLNRAHLDYYYWIMAGLSALNLCAYVWMAKRFVYKKIDQEDGIEEGKTIN